MSTLSVSLVPGYLWKDDDVLTPALMRLIAQPAINLIGTLGTAVITDASVTTAKLADAALSADTLGRGKMADGFLTLTKIATGIFTADSDGRAPFAAGWLTQTLMDDTTRLGAQEYAAGTTTAGAMAATLATVPASYFAGMTVKILVDTTNTGATTLNLNSLGAKNILKNVNQALAAGDLVAGDIVTLIYDGTQFQLQRRNAAAIVASSRNLTVKQNAGTPTAKVDLAADEILLKDTNGLSLVAATVGLTVDLTGSGLLGLDTASRAIGTWYYLWAISNGTTTSAIFSLSTTAPTMPSGYTFKALVGMVHTKGSGVQQGAINSFMQTDRKHYCAPVVTTAAANVATLTGAVPPIAKSCWGSSGTGLWADSYSGGNIAEVNGSNFDLPLITASTLYCTTGQTVTVYGFTF